MPQLWDKTMALTSAWQPQTCHLDIKYCFISPAWKKGYISSSGSRCPSSRHRLCNGPLTAATDSLRLFPQRPSETCPSHLQIVFESGCYVRGSFLIVSAVMTWEEEKRSLRRMSKGHCLWENKTACPRVLCESRNVIQLVKDSYWKTHGVWYSSCTVVQWRHWPTIVLPNWLYLKNGGTWFNLLSIKDTCAIKVYCTIQGRKINK